MSMNGVLLHLRKRLKQFTNVSAKCVVWYRMLSNPSTLVWRVVLPSCHRHRRHRCPRHAVIVVIVMAVIVIVM